MDIDDNYSVEADANNFVLKYENTYFNDKTNKNTTTTREWFCTDLEHVNKIYIRECLREEIMSNKTLEELVEFIKNKKCIK